MHHTTDVVVYTALSTEEIAGHVIAHSDDGVGVQIQLYNVIMVQQLRDP